MKAIHEGGGYPSLDYNTGIGNLRIDGPTLIAQFPTDELGEFPAEFQWEASTQTIILGDPTDPADYSAVNDYACPPLQDGGQSFRGD